MVDDPWRMDPFRLFASYPTEWLSPWTIMSLVPGMSWETAKGRLTRGIANYTPQVLPTVQETEALYAALAATAQAPVTQLVEGFPVARRQTMERALLWFAKYGIARLSGMSNVIAD